MIRECVDAYKALIETVSGIGTVVPYARITTDQGVTKTVYPDNVVLVNYSKIRKFTDQTSEAIWNPITLQVSVCKKFVDFGSYSGSTQEAFDTLLDNLLSTFDEDGQSYVSSGATYGIGDIKEIKLMGDSGTGDFLGKAYHIAQFEQEIYLIE